MPTLTLKNIPGGLYDRLKASAVANRRSLNSEILERLDASLGGRPLDPAAFLARADALRERLSLPPLTEKGLKKAKAVGRP
jgi:plasmid stability protein